MGRVLRDGRRSAFPTPVGVKLALVAEDDDELRGALQMLLEDHGFAVFAARNGADAIAQLSFMPRPDVVVTDCLMPLASGLELVARLRAMPGCATTPVVLLTVVTDALIDSDKHVRVLHKPIDVDDLLSAVHEVTRDTAC